MVHVAKKYKKCTGANKLGCRCRTKGKLHGPYYYLVFYRKASSQRKAGTTWKYVGTKPPMGTEFCYTKKGFVFTSDFNLQETLDKIEARKKTKPLPVKKEQEATPAVKDMYGYTLLPKVIEQIQEIQVFKPARDVCASYRGGKACVWYKAGDHTCACPSECPMPMPGKKEMTNIQTVFLRG